MPSSVPFSPTPESVRSAAPRICAPDRSVPQGPVLPGDPVVDPLLVLSPYEVSVSTTSALCFHKASPPGLGHIPKHRNAPGMYLLFRVLKNHRDAPPLSRWFSLHGVLCFGLLQSRRMLSASGAPWQRSLRATFPSQPQKKQRPQIWNSVSL
jgi:hypothetical protein